VLLLRLQLRLATAREASNSTTHRASDAVRNTAAEIIQLALRFLGLAFGILLPALLLEILFHASVNNGF